MRVCVHRVDAMGVTTAALWTPPVRLPPVAVPDMSNLSSRNLRRALADPRVLTVLVVLGLMFVLGFRQPIARTIGTAAPEPVVQTSVRPLLQTAPVFRLPRPVEAPVAVPVHAPRDPFAPISRESTTTAAAYRVHAGDSLWSIAR